MKLALGIIASVLPALGFTPLQASDSLRKFLGNNGAELAWSDAESSGPGVIKFADLTAGTTPITICEGAFPRLGTDATHLLYVDPSGAICIRTCIAASPDADRRFITSAGRSPAWWTRPSDGARFVTYTANSGELWCQKLDKGYRPDGAATLLYSSPIGTFFTYTPRSSDGRFFATREDGAGMWSISPSYAVAAPISSSFITYTGNGSTVVEGFCHGDCSPAANPASPFYGCLMHFYMGAHEAFYVRKFDPGDRTPGATAVGVYGITDSGNVVARIAAPPAWGDSTYTAWDEIRWTSRPDIIAAGALRSAFGRSDLFLVKPSDSSMIRLGFGIGVGYSMWIDTNLAKPLASLPVASALRGKAPFTVHFDGTASTGASLTYRWDFADGAYSSAAAIDHTYQRAGAYRAWLVVGNGTAVDSSYLPVVVDSIDAAASRLDLYPGPAVTVDIGNSVYFSGRAVDSAGNDLPIDSATWSVVGSSGGTVTTQGVYTTGHGAGSDTVRVSVGSLQASCVVNVAPGTALGFSRPEAGAVVSIGDTLGIVLTVDTTRVRRALLYYSGNGGRTMALITRTGSLLLDRSVLAYQWPVPAKIENDSTPSDSAMIIAADYDGIEPTASSAMFSIRGTSKVRKVTPAGQLKIFRPIVGMDRIVGEIPAGASITLHDALGRLVGSRNNQANQAVPFSMNTPRPGVYFVTLHSSGVSRVTRLVVK